MKRLCVFSIVSVSEDRERETQEKIFQKTHRGICRAHKGNKIMFVEVRKCSDCIRRSNKTVFSPIQFLLETQTHALKYHAHHSANYVFL
jgi:hypothetical protein